MEHTSQGFGQRGHLVRQSVRHRHAEPFGHGGRVGEQAVHVRAEADQVQTEVSAAIQAVHTGVAGQVGIHGHAVAYFQATHVRTDFDHPSTPLVPEDDTGVRTDKLTLHDVRVSAAQATRENL
jgi:hypothetical protein